MTTALHRLVNRSISRIKGAQYRVDDAIPLSYLGLVVVERGVMKLRGIARFTFSTERPFIGRGVTIRARSKLTIGSGVTFGHFSFVDALSIDGVHLGDNVSLGRHSRIECTGSLRTLGKGLRVGRDVGLGTDCLYGCAGGIDIGDDTIIGNFVSFHSETHVTDDLTVPTRLQGVSHQGITVGPNCWIGAKVTVLDGAHIGSGCVIAAGSVVTAGTYAADTVYGGIPAKRLKVRTPATEVS